jgi:hypothetical protein
MLSWYDDVKNRAVNPEIRARPPQIFQAPEVYIALPPEGGIPALTEFGTGTGTGSEAEDTPGSAVCSIWKINSNGVFQEMIGLTKTVYNLSREVIPQTINGVDQNWIKIVRTKPGKWIAPTDSNSQGFDRCNAELTEDITSTGTGSVSTSVTNIVATKGLSPVSSPGETVVALNLFKWEASAGAICKIEYNYEDSAWEMYQVDGCSNA